MHDGMPCDPIQGSQGHGVCEVPKIALFPTLSRNGRYFALFQQILVAFGAHCVKVHVRYLIS